jgi:hypothetical protein
LLEKSTPMPYAYRKKLLRETPGFSGATLILATSQALIGDIENVAWEIEELLSILPHFSLSTAHSQALFGVLADMEVYLSGLEKAGQNNCKSIPNVVIVK